MMRRAVVVLLALAGVAHGDDFGDATIIFQRGAALYRVTATGKSESQLATLPAKSTVRAMRTDAAGTILLADIGGEWSYLKLDGQATTLTPLPCGAGPAQLAEDGSCVVCKAAQGDGSIIYNFAVGKPYPVDVPAGARLVGEAADRTLVWADSSGIWGAKPGKLAAKKQLAPAPPLRGFLASPDGSRAVGVYAGEVFESIKKKTPGDVFTIFALDGTAARRRLGALAMPLEWSHDGSYVLVQTDTTACLVGASGGEYKCWRGFTAASLSPDGRWGLLYGTGKPAEKPTTKTDADVPLAAPSGSSSLYRARLEGAYTDKPTLLVKSVDGAAVWVPKHP